MVLIMLVVVPESMWLNLQLTQSHDVGTHNYNNYFEGFDKMYKF